MNILVIGNGFDLAHGLPTKYTDFWTWIKDLIYIKGRIDWKEEIPTTIKDFLNWRNKWEELWAIKFDESFLSYYWECEEEDDEFEQRMLLGTSAIKEWIKDHDELFDYERDIIDINMDLEDFLRDDKINKIVKLKNFIDVLFTVSKKK